jgi:hypothetical protein
MLGVAGLVAMVAAIVPRLLSGPAEHPVPGTPAAADVFTGPGLRMGLQAAAAALVVVGLNQWFGLEKSVWSITERGKQSSAERSG